MARTMDELHMKVLKCRETLLRINAEQAPPGTWVGEAATCGRSQRRPSPND